MAETAWLVESQTGKIKEIGGYNTFPRDEVNLFDQKYSWICWHCSIDRSDSVRATAYDEPYGYIVYYFWQLIGDKIVTFSNNPSKQYNMETVWFKLNQDDRLYTRQEYAQQDAEIVTLKPRHLYCGDEQMSPIPNGSKPGIAESEGKVYYFISNMQVKGPLYNVTYYPQERGSAIGAKIFYKTASGEEESVFYNDDKQKWYLVDASKEYTMKYVPTKPVELEGDWAQKREEIMNNLIKKKKKEEEERRKKEEEEKEAKTIPIKTIEEWDVSALKKFSTLKFGNNYIYKSFIHKKYNNNKEPIAVTFKVNKEQGKNKDGTPERFIYIKIDGNVQWQFSENFVNVPNYYLNNLDNYKLWTPSSYKNDKEELLPIGVHAHFFIENITSNNDEAINSNNDEAIKSNNDEAINSNNDEAIKSNINRTFSINKGNKRGGKSSRRKRKSRKTKRRSKLRSKRRR